MNLTQQELNFIVIVIVAIIGIGIPIYICCFACFGSYWCKSTSRRKKTKCNKKVAAKQNQIKATIIFLSKVKLIDELMFQCSGNTYQVFPNNINVGDGRDYALEMGGCNFLYNMIQ